MKTNKSNNRSYVAVYKCSLCGKTLVDLKHVIQLSAEEIPTVISKISDNQYDLPLYTTHDCGNRNFGMAKFIGLKDCINLL